MEWNNLVGPAVVAAIVSAVVALVGMWLNRSTVITLQRERIETDQRLFERKVESDIYLAKQRFIYDRQQAVFKRRFELAEKFLADIYHAQALIKYVRNGAAFSNEGNTRESIEKESENVKRNRDTYFVPLERLKLESAFLSEMFAKQTACHANFGDDARKAFQLIQGAIQRIQAASYLLIEWTTDTEFPDQKTYNQLRDDIWEPMAEIHKTNEIGKMVEEAVALTESICKPILAWVDKP